MFRILLITFLSMVSLNCISVPSGKEIIELNKAELIPNSLDRSMLIGTWYGKHNMSEGGYREHIVQRFSDGSYRIRFKERDREGNVELSSEVGLWGMSGNIYFTIFRGWLDGQNFKPSDPAVDTNYDAYYILELTNERFNYKHARTGNSYTINKVADGYSFPE